jgi:hypothetical protein
MREIALPPPPPTPKTLTLTWYVTGRSDEAGEGEFWILRRFAAMIFAYLLRNEVVQNLLEPGADVGVYGKPRVFFAVTCVT